MPDLERETLEACAAALRQHNFKPKRRGLLLQPGVTKGVGGWLGLNTATFRLPASLEVNPVVGVRYDALEAAMIELDGRKAPLPSISKPLGYLMPENRFRQWSFAASGDLSATADSLATAVADFGQPFIDRYSDWDTFASDIESSGLLADHDKAKVLPIIAALNGDRVAADERVQLELDRIGESDDMYARSYREFASGFAAKAFDEVSK